MRPFSDSVNDEAASGSVVDLEFPDSPGLEPRFPEIPLPEMIRRCRELRMWFPDSIPTQEERLAEKCEVAFRL